MFSRIRKRITYTNVAMTLVLVFAMSGGAYAASKYLITSTKQISPKVLKALKGKNGVNGVNGANGANGVNGKDGAQGPAGEKGANGEKGASGEGVASTPLVVKNAHCEEGGSEFTAGGNHTYACTGSPWPAGGTLPSGKSEEGVWSYVDEKASAGGKTTAISFVMPLKTAPEAHFIGTNEELFKEAKESPAIKEGKCIGSPKEPQAASGNLCVFATSTSGANAFDFIDPQTPAAGLNVSGMAGTLIFFNAAPGTVFLYGTWTVTAG
jgi:hypothetical protein